jgi:hypothetical protein
VAAVNPGYTADLPGILIEDISSTDTYAIAQSDSARVETINSLTPLGANAFLLLQLGQMLGVPVGAVSNTSVFVVFSSGGIPGVVIGKGFIVTDGTYQYALNSGGITKADGFTDPLFAIAILPGIWAVPPNTVTALVTSAPPGIPLTVTNPQTGIPGSDVGLTETDYRMRVLQANLAASQGMARYLRTLLSNVPGVQARLINPLMNPYGTPGQWKIIVGGGDPYQVAYAIYQALFDISSIVGSVTHVTNVTNTDPAVVTTDINHGLDVGNTIEYHNTITSGWDGTYRVFSVPSPTTFTFGQFSPANPLVSGTWLSNVITFTTTNPHLLISGQQVSIAECIPDQYNSLYVCTVTGASTFTVPKIGNPGLLTTPGVLGALVTPFDGTGLPVYAGGGEILPNERNIMVSIEDHPDTYTFPIVIPPQQSVTLVISWNTISPNFVDPVGIAQAVQQPIADYVNSVIVGQPLSLIEIRKVFVDSVVTLLSIELISVLTVDVSINGIGTAPTGQLVFGDPESFFFSLTSDIIVVKL